MFCQDFFNSVFVTRVSFQGFNELKELRLLDVHGFRSVDEHPSRERSTEVVLHEGEDLMSIGNRCWETRQSTVRKVICRK